MKAFRLQQLRVLLFMWHQLCEQKPMPKAKAKAPWKKAAPKNAKHTKLSGSQKATAKRSAQKAGRPYPNLVDNMKAAKKKN